MSTVIISIESSPPRLFLGNGNSHADAVQSATVHALMFYFYMAQSLNQANKWNI